jgi:protein-tyrosine phosphatase
MIDIHCHILPGVDDGAQTVEDSIALAQEAVDNGITTIIATPHHRNGIYTNEKLNVLQKVDELQMKLDERNISLKILPGQEVHVYGEILEDLSNKQLLTLNHTQKYILLELPYDHIPRFMDQLIFDIQMLGIVPIIPHPERNAKLREHPELLYKMVKRGALSQVTAASLLGKFGKEPQKFSLQCIEHHMCHLIASDAHRAGKRGVILREAYDAIEKKLGSSISSQFERNAEKVAEGKEFYVDPPEKIEKKRSLFGFLRRSGT